MLTLNTSGTVHAHIPDHDDPFAFTWETLPSDFVRGYLAGMLESLSVDQIAHWLEHVDPYSAPSFRHLSPSALTEGIADCAAFQNYCDGLGVKTNQASGERFWNGRQSKALPGAWGAAFPPVLISLSNDGKIYLGRAK
jgi:hypothetical protein